MYNLGDQFKINTQAALAPASSIIKGNKYRFTILTPRVIRLEYNVNGIFSDEPTELILRRNLPSPQFQLNDDDKYLEVTTEYFRLSYTKERNFEGSKVNPTEYLKIESLKNKKIWYYNHPEVRNYGIPAADLTVAGHGLYSPDGFATINDSYDYIFNQNGTVKEKKSLDIYLFVYGNDFELALIDYYEMTGYPSMIPRYALGNWWSRNDDYDDAKLKELVDTFEKKEIPISTILLDKDWHKRTYLGKKHLKTGFTFNDKYFQNPSAMITYLHQKKIKLGLNINPIEGLTNIDTYYNEALKYLKADKRGIIPFNTFDPKFVDVYLKFFIHPLDNLGIDFYWLDMDEETNIPYLALLKHYQFYDMYRDFKRRPMVLGQDTLIAPHRYPVLYSGKTIVSWSTLRKIPFYNISAFNNGVSFWAHDIGGYFGGIEDSELYARFVQLGTFSPILKFGCEKGRYYKREPWLWDIKTYNIVKQYLTLRHKLIPYIYSEAYKYHKDGAALVKPLYLYNHDLYNDALYKNEYFFGSEMLICPILNPKDNVMNRSLLNFYMPEGIWYDFVTSKKFLGDKKYVSFFKDEEYPVFVRAGSIIPLSNNQNLNDTTPPKDMEIHIFPGKDNTYTLFEDDGESDLFRKDYYLITDIEYTYLPNNYSVIIRSMKGKSGIIPKKRNYKIVFRNTKRTEDLVVYSNKNQVSFKTYVDGPNFIVEINDVSTIGQLTVNCRGKDIEIDAVRLINNEIESIISDLQIPTKLKEKIDEVLFSDLSIQKKRIEVRKLKRDGLDKKFIRMFIKLLEYISTI